MTTTKCVLLSLLLLLAARRLLASAILLSRAARTHALPTRTCLWECGAGHASETDLHCCSTSLQQTNQPILPIVEGAHHCAVSACMMTMFMMRTVVARLGVA